MRFELLIDAAEFWQRLQEDLRAARTRVWLQTLSLEADSAGLPLAAELEASAATSRRVLIDAFCQHIISDRFIYSPRNSRNAELQNEVRATRAMIDRLRRNEVQVGITNPAGLLWHRLAARDHRKLILIDEEIAYIGGINFSEHNFGWHDLMIRIEDPAIAEFLRNDYAATWAGKPVNARACFDGIELFNLSGHGNEAMTEPTLEAIRSARKSILAITPYLTFPFTDAMADARAQGAVVTILSPAINNRVSLRRYVHRIAAQHGFELRHYQGRMSHLKAMLLDDERVIVGSSNFDWPTYHMLAETIGIIDDASFLRDFRRRVVEPDLANSVLVQPGTEKLGWYGALQHRMWAWAGRNLGGPRVGKRVALLD